MSIGGNNFGLGHGFGSQKKGVPPPPKPNNTRVTSNGNARTTSNGRIRIIVP